MLLLLLTTGIGEMALSENRLAPNPVVDYHFLLSKCIDIYIYIHTGWGPQSIAFSWFRKVAELTMVYGRYKELVNGEYFMVCKPTFTSLGGPHPVPHLTINKQYTFIIIHCHKHVHYHYTFIKE